MICKQLLLLRIDKIIEMNAHISGFLMNILDHIIKPVKTKLKSITILATSRNQRLAGNYSI